MFKWLKRLDPEASSIGGMDRMFGRMLQDGRHVFDLACSAYLEGADASIVHADLVKTDQGINKLEREIRRALIVHATVHGVSEFPPCLVLMSVTKDAERIGDYAKNILDLATLRPKKPEAPYHAHLMGLKSRISSALADAHDIYDAQDAKRAAAFIESAEVIKDECDDKVEEILLHEGESSVGPAEPAATALCYRYFKRVISHARNVVTSLVVSVDRLDYYDESDETRN
ncbi:MAG: PhoU domain-containing protein [Planctomycetota bacterium]|nr:PhoU domain-containing protein [Planctomycetota bacterium]